MIRNREENRKKGNKVRIISRIIFFVAIIFIVSGISLIVIDRYLFPYLATAKWAAKYKIFEKATKDIVVVNKTEQVTVSEDQTISNYSSRSASGVVEILSQKRSGGNQEKMNDTTQVRYGSGLIVTADGLILTFKDAIFTDQSKYHIFIAQNKSFEAKLMAVDSFTGLALLKIDDVSNLPAASFIAPEDMKAGLKVVAIGRNGSNFQAVYKSGLVSQYDEDFSLAGALANSEKIQGVFLADFHLTDEKSERTIGGPVVNYNGNVIGILGVRKMSDQKQYFLVSSDLIQEFVNQYISSGSVKRGSLGVYYRPLSGESAVLFGGDSRGAIVFSPSGQQGLAVIAGSAAEKAGIKIKDVITHVNGEEVNQEKNLARLISKYKQGEAVKLKILRDGKEMEVTAVLQ